MRKIIRSFKDRRSSQTDSELVLSDGDLAALRQYVQFSQGNGASAYRLSDAAFTKAVWATLAIENPDVLLEQVEDAIQALGGQEAAAEQQRRGPHHEFVPS